MSLLKSRSNFESSLNIIDYNDFIRVEPKETNEVSSPSRSIFHPASDENFSDSYEAKQKTKLNKFVIKERKSGQIECSNQLLNPGYFLTQYIL